MKFRILYGIDDCDIAELLVKQGRENLTVDCCKLQDIEARIKANAGYDFIVIHLRSKDSGEIDNLPGQCNLARKCKALSKYIHVIAESELWPEYKEEVIHSFDDYFPLLSMSGTLDEMIAKYAKIPNSK